jgi:hypothetical protein
MLDNVSTLLDSLLTPTQNFLYTVFTFALYMLVTLKNLIIMVFDLGIRRLWVRSLVCIKRVQVELLPSTSTWQLQGY